MILTSSLRGNSSVTFPARPLTPLLQAGRGYRKLTSISRQFISIATFSFGSVGGRKKLPNSPSQVHFDLDSRAPNPRSTWEACLQWRWSPPARMCRKSLLLRHARLARSPPAFRRLTFAAGEGRRVGARAGVVRRQGWRPPRLPRRLRSARHVGEGWRGGGGKYRKGAGRGRGLCGM